MDILDRTIWQQASGDTNRDYAEWCLKWDVILNGPGRFGAFPGCVEVLKQNGISQKKITDLKRFSEIMLDKDLVVLRLGTKDILGVGEVVGNYEWRNEFGDIDGWDLQHVRRVRWLWKRGVETGGFSKYDLKQGDTTQVLTSKPVLEWLRGLNIPRNALDRDLVTLPEETDADVTYEAIAEFMFGKGVASQSIRRLLQEIDELVRIAKWYQDTKNPSESETVAYLVVPLLRALGWTPQRMAVEWNNVDLALFDTLPREDANMAIVVEAKRRGASCLTALSQAQAYALGKPNCKRLIVTDGLRYGVYIKKGKEFLLHAYMNLTRLRDHYSVYGCAGAPGALLTMTPEWSSNIADS